MICRDSLLWRNVAEHSFLLVVVAAHSLVSLTFLTSDEFFELKLQQEWVFQQTAKLDSSLSQAALFQGKKFTHTGNNLGDANWTVENGSAFLDSAPTSEPTTPWNEGRP